MTRERENELVIELRRIEARKRELIRAIVEASLSDEEAKDEMSEIDRLSKRKSELTRPSLSAAAA